MSSKIGLIAGNGSFPLVFAREARRKGNSIVAVALKEEAHPSLEENVDRVAWLSIGQLGKAIHFFKEEGVQKAVMAGQVKHTQLFKDFVPDLRTAKILVQASDHKAETLLSAVLAEFEREGIHFLPSTLYLDHLLAPLDLLSRRRLESREEKDLRFGIPLARTLASQDIGQTLVVKDQTVVAAEAMEGTDETIRRAGKVAGPGCVVIKAARPQQDPRFDVPVVGSRTLDALLEAGATVLGVEAGKTLLLDRESLLEKANASGLSVIGF